MKENDSDQERLSGQSVLYGAQIQLQHTFTKKFLAVNPSFTSLLESTNLKVRLKVMLMDYILMTLFFKACQKCFKVECYNL